MASVLAARVEDVWPGELLGVRVAGLRVLLLWSGDRIVAFHDRCAHLATALSEGVLHGDEIVCRVHGWRYCAATGRGRNPANVALRPLTVRIEGGAVWVEVEDG